MLLGALISAPMLGRIYFAAWTCCSCRRPVGVLSGLLGTGACAISPGAGVLARDFRLDQLRQ